MHTLRLMAARCTDCVYTTNFLKDWFHSIKYISRQFRDLNATEWILHTSKTSYLYRLFFLRANNMQIIWNEFISRCCYKSYTALSQWPLHVLFFHCLVISMQTLCKPKVRAVQWRSSWFLSGKWRCCAVEAISLPRRFSFFLKQRDTCSVRCDMDLSENCTWLCQLFKKLKFIVY